MTAATPTEFLIFNITERRFFWNMPKEYSDEVKMCGFLLMKMGLLPRAISRIFHGHPGHRAVERHCDEVEKRIKEKMGISVQPQMEQVPPVLVARH